MYVWGKSKPKKPTTVKWIPTHSEISGGERAWEACVPEGEKVCESLGEDTSVRLSLRDTSCDSERKKVR